MKRPRIEILEAALQAVDSADDATPFSELLKIASRGGAFDATRHLRYADWTGVDFGCSDLAGCDFTGAQLAGSSFAEARILGARFDGARIATVRPGANAISGVNFRAAVDWEEFVARWEPRSTPPTDEHLLPGTVFQDAPFGPEMVVVPAGNFTRHLRPEDSFSGGSEVTQDVAIDRPFAVGRFSVAFDEWDVCVRRGGSGHEPSDEGWGRGRRPVINVSWHDAKAYTDWLSRETGKNYRLLSEGERDYVAAAGASTPFWCGNTISTDQANFNGSAASRARRRSINRRSTVSVDSFAPNRWGLYNVHGNVWEWVEDAWRPDYATLPQDGSPWIGADLSQRVLKGGCWENHAEYLRIGERNRGSYDTRGPGFGFRVARNLNG
jgi:formylglycine-generating enzyme required for sulfatase activity